MKISETDDRRNTLVKPNLETNHSFNFNDSKIFIMHNKQHRKMLNVAFFLINTIKQRPVSFQVIFLFS